jgi:hypothetical protein
MVVHGYCNERQQCSGVRQGVTGAGWRQPSDIGSTEFAQTKPAGAGAVTDLPGRLRARVEPSDLQSVNVGIGARAADPNLHSALHVMELGRWAAPCRFRNYAQ